MNVVLRKAMTLEQFLAWEERQPLRYEFDGWAPVAMTGGTTAHDSIQMNLHAALVTRLRGRPCRPHGSDLKVLVDGRIRYPDAFVVCTPVARDATIVPDPVVVFEILSDSTANTDLIEKNAEYRATPTIQSYVVLQQTHAAAIVFHRKGDDWLSDVLSGMDSVLRLPAISIEIPLAELYADVELAGDPPADNPA